MHTQNSPTSILTSEEGGRFVPLSNTVRTPGGREADQLEMSEPLFLFEASLLAGDHCDGSAGKPDMESGL